MINRVYDSATITLDGSDAESWRVLKGLNVVETISKSSDYINTARRIVGSSCKCRRIAGATHQSRPLMHSGTVEFSHKPILPARAGEVDRSNVD